MFEDSRLTNQLRKSDYQREFYSLIKALEESIDPAPDADSITGCFPEYAGETGRAWKGFSR